MNREPSTPPPEESPSLQERTDGICDAFEIRLKDGACPRIEDLLGTAAGHERRALLRELLRLEVEYRRQGDRPALDEYLQRFPGESDLVHFVFAEATSPAPRSAPGPEEPAPPSLPGYEILEELGRGGMGLVYKARQVNLGRLVALKILRSGQQADREDLARFCTEAEAVARLQHPNIVQIFAVGEPGGMPFFAMEYCGGRSLERRPGGLPLPPPEAANLVAILARAVQAAHDKDIIHRDLKPANVLLTEDGIPKVSDFGLAKKLDVAQGQTHSNAVLGTPSYMAPEQARGDARAVGPAADVYALGAILYDCLTGRPPFRAPTVLDTLAQVVGAEPVPVRRLQPKVPRDLETICLKCLEKEPAKRYASAAALADDLERSRNGEPIKARPVRPWERAWRWAKRKPALATALGAVLLTVVTAFVLIMDSRNEAIQLARDKGQLATDMTAVADRNQQLLKKTEKLAGERAAALEEERQQRQRAEWELYRGQIDAGFYAVRDASPRGGGLWATNAQIALTLEACRWDLRGWEYYHLRDRIDSSRLTFTHLGPFVHGLCFSPDGKRLAVGAGKDVLVWETAEGRLLYRGIGHQAAINRVVFADDGTFFVTASRDETVRVWDGEDKVRTFSGHKNNVISLAVSPDGKHVASGDGSGAVLVWETATLKVVRSDQEHRSGVACLTFLGAGQELLSAGTDGRLVRRPIAGAGGAKVEELSPGSIAAAAVSCDRSWLALRAQPEGGKTRILLRNLSPPRPVQAFGIPERRERTLLVAGGVAEMVCAAHGKWVVLAAGDRAKLSWVNVETGSEDLMVRSNLFTGVFGLALSPDGGTVAAGEEGVVLPAEVKLWDVAADLSRAQLRNSSRIDSGSRFTTDCCVGPDLLVTSQGSLPFGNSADRGWFEVWDFPVLGAKPRALIAEQSDVLCVALSPDSRGPGQRRCAAPEGAGRPTVVNPRGQRQRRQQRGL